MANNEKYRRDLLNRSQIISRRAALVKSNPVGSAPTDRALRYRANAAMNELGAPAHCAWCGKRLKGREAMVAHVDGREENNSPENLAWTCRSCNTKTANVAKRAGLGRRTRQYNPSGNDNPSGNGAKTLGAYINAILSMKGEAGGNMDVAAAVDLIHNTPQSTRSMFAKEIWARRRERRSSEVPF